MQFCNQKTCLSQVWDVKWAKQFGHLSLLLLLIIGSRLSAFTAYVRPDNREIWHTATPEAETMAWTVSGPGEPGPLGPSGPAYGQPEVPPPAYEQSTTEYRPPGPSGPAYGQPETPPPAYEQSAPQSGPPRPPGPSGPPGPAYGQPEASPPAYEQSTPQSGQHGPHSGPQLWGDRLVVYHKSG